MRVIAGAWGGRRLQAPAGAATRPTSDRVREALFSILGDRVEGARVLDLFAGSGALGIEALSRGAAEATFVDARRAAVAGRRGQPRRRSATEARGAPRATPCGASAAHRAARRQYDLVFLDPPYRLAAAPRARAVGGPAGRAGARRAGGRPRATAGRRSTSTCPASTNAATATPSSASMAPDNRIAVCPGSYDPITNGHVDVISARRGDVRRADRRASSTPPCARASRCSPPRSACAFIEDATAHLAQRAGRDRSTC